MIHPFQYFAAGALSIFLGVLLGSYFSLNPWLGGVVIVFCLIGIWSMPLAWMKFWLVILACIVLGMIRFEIGTLNQIPVQYLNEPIAVSGRIVSHPEIQNGQQSFYLLTDMIDEAPNKYKILLQTFPLPVFEYGTTVRTVLTLKADNESSYLRYLRKDSVVAIAKTKSEVELIKEAPPSLLGSLYIFRDSVSMRINSLYPEPASGLMNGLLLGLRVQLSDELKENLKNSGTTHIIALSGFNITIIASFLLFLARPLKRNWALVLAGVGILLFVLMTGASSSVTRAAIMGWILLMTMWWGRRRHSFNAVLVAGAIMVLINPYILQYDIGFQLSLVATIGIIALVPLITPWLWWLPKVLGEIVSATISATVLTLPLAVFHFGGFSSMALVSNLLILPLIPWVMLVGFVSLILTMLIPLSAINIFGVMGANIILWIINWFGEFRTAFVKIPDASVWVPVIYYSILLLALSFANGKKHDKT